MTERPILFNAPMVRAILEGTKTQTRRVVRPCKDAGIGCELAPNELAGEVNAGDFLNALCQPGDRLWVRETFAIVPRTAYRCSEGVQQTLRPDDDHDAAIYRAGWERSRSGFSWKPSIHMPRWASRITLEVTGVRVERLQDISEADALAEGISRLAPPAPPHEWSGLNRFTLNGMGSGFCAGSVSWNSPTAEALYLRLWEDINGPGSWEANPWVWVVEFKRVSP